MAARPREGAPALRSSGACVTAFQDVENAPPSAADLAWEADRLTLAELPAEQQAWFSTLADAICQAWPVEEPDYADLDPEEHGDNKCIPIEWWETLDGRLRDLEIPIEQGEEGNVDADELADAIKAAIEAARAEGEKDATIPSRANTAQRKAMRLLIEGRLEVLRRETNGDMDGLIVAQCRGDSGTRYTLGYDPHRNQWRCTCPELRGECSHLRALKLVAPAVSTTDRGR